MQDRPPVWSFRPVRALLVIVVTVVTLPLVAAAAARGYGALRMRAAQAEWKAVLAPAELEHAHRAIGRDARLARRIFATARLFALGSADSIDRCASALSSIEEAAGRLALLPPRPRTPADVLLQDWPIEAETHTRKLLLACGDAALAHGRVDLALVAVELLGAVASDLQESAARTPFLVGLRFERDQKVLIERLRDANLPAQERNPMLSRLGAAIPQTDLATLRRQALASEILYAELGAAGRTLPDAGPLPALIVAVIGPVMAAATVAAVTSVLRDEPHLHFWPLSAHIGRQRDVYVRGDRAGVAAQAQREQLRRSLED